MWQYTDHPRGCGEHDTSHIRHVVEVGSSPRMRGALFVNLHAVVTERIIPADAGSTTCVSAPRRMSEDHPRGCGEHEDR